jgi:hypothetical protein
LPLALLLPVLGRPPLALGLVPLPVGRVAAGVRARPAVAGRVEVEHRGDDVGEPRAVVADQHHTARVLAQLRGEVVETACVEVVGRLVEQQQVVPRAQQAGQPDAVALPHGERGERPRAVVDRTEGGEGEVDPSVGVPRVHGLRGRQRLGVGLLGAGLLLGEIGDRGVEPPQHGADAGELDVDEVADRRVARGPEHRRRPVGRDGDLLVRDTDGAGPAHRTGVGCEGAGEHLEQGGLAAAVLPDDAEVVARRDGEVDAGQDGAAAARDVHAGRGQVG